MTGFVFSEKPIDIERGEGVSLYDTDDREYLDFGASYASTSGWQWPTGAQA